MLLKAPCQQSIMRMRSRSPEASLLLKHPCLMLIGVLISTLILKNFLALSNWTSSILIYRSMYSPSLIASSTFNLFGGMSCICTQKGYHIRSISSRVWLESHLLRTNVAPLTAHGPLLLPYSIYVVMYNESCMKRFLVL